MVGILLVTHNGLGDSLADCVKHVLGVIPEHLKTLSVLANDEPQQKLAQGRALIQQLDAGSGVLVLVDVYGATPCNIARELCQGERVMGVAGVNLPMLLRAVNHSNDSLPELVQLVLEGGRNCIVQMNPEN